MLRISWPLALLLAVAIAVIARRPRMIVPILIVFAAFALWQAVAGRRRRR